MSGAIAIRRGSGGDLDLIARIAVESWRSTGLARDGEGSEAERRGRFAGQMAGGCLLYVAEMGEKAVGFVLFDPTTRYLAQLFVAPEAQGQGVGRTLLALAREWMPDEIWLKTPADNRRVIDWYGREGFVKANEAADPGPPPRSIVVCRWRARP